MPSDDLDASAAPPSPHDDDDDADDDADDVDEYDPDEYDDDDDNDGGVVNINQPAAGELQFNLGSAGGDQGNSPTAEAGIRVMPKVNFDSSRT